MSFLFFSCKSDYILEWKILLRALGLLLSLDNAAPFCVFYSACSLTTPCCSAVVFVGCEDGQKADFFSSSWAPAWWEWEQVISVFIFPKSCRKQVFTWTAFRRFFTPSWIFCVFKAPLALPCLGLSSLRSAP